MAYTDEGVELRKAGITLPIMVMNAEEVTYDQMVQYNLEPEIFSFNILSGEIRLNKMMLIMIFLILLMIIKCKLVFK